MRRALGIAASVALFALTLGVLFTPTAVVDAAVPLTPSVKPDAVLSPGDTFVKVSKNLNISDDAFLHYPSECRDGSANLRCDVYRIKLNRNLAPDALNFVFFSVEFEALYTTPDLALVAAGLSGIPVGDIDVQVYDKDDHYLGQDYPSEGDVEFALGLVGGLPVPGLPGVVEQLKPILVGDDTETGDINDVPPGGTGFDTPERGGFTAKQDLYDIIVLPVKGFNSEYTLRVGFSDDKFALPFEVLDPESTAPGFGSDPVETPSDTSPSGNSSTEPPLADANVAPDADLGGIGLGINERFEAPPAFAFRGARNVSKTGPPSGVALVVGLLVAPLGAAVGATLFLRRRRQALI